MWINRIGEGGDQCEEIHEDLIAEGIREYDCR